MRTRYPLPRLWMLTDERQGEALWLALKSLPRGSGVIVRHYSLSVSARRTLFDRVRAIAKARRLVLVLADSHRQASRWGSEGVYGARPMPRTTALLWAAPVHNLREIRRAERLGADLLLLSPLFPTRSHPDAPTLGSTQFAALASATHLPVFALGGIKPHHRRLLDAIGAYGWAGIDAFIGGHRPARA